MLKFVGKEVIPIWIYKSPIGEIAIVNKLDKEFTLLIDGIYYGSYFSAVAAADDVYTFSTGCYEWDKHCAEIDYQLNTPSDISAWQRLF